MGETEILTPAARPRRPVPRWSLGALIGAVVFDSTVSHPNHALQAAAVVLSIGASIADVMWFEGRIYVALSSRPPMVHLALTLVLVPVGFLAGALAGGLEGAIFKGDLAPAAFVVGGVWFASASAGSAVVQFVDLFGRVFASRFSARILLTVFGLMLAAAVTTAVIVVGIPKGVAVAMAKAPDSFKIKLGGDAMTGSEFSKLLERGGLPAIPAGWSAAEVIGWGLAAVAILLLVPGLISASSKLGELAMERVHPLDLALQRVAEGDFTVRVEEGGSIEFKRLGVQFNRMVASLDLAHRMERAFGAYVSQPIIDRIRAQHGQVELPSTQKEATVFFADVRGFTAMSERLAPERVLDVLNRYYGYVAGVVDDHEGYIDKFIGDAVYVVFNAPIDQPDHVVRATRCAIALQEKIIILNASGAFPEIGRLEVGVGVATGPVVAGNLGTKRTQFSVIGDTVNLASRLCQHAPAGEVWVNARTAEGLPPEVSRVALEPISVKGKSKPILVHRVFPCP